MIPATLLFPALLAAPAQAPPVALVVDLAGSVAYGAGAPVRLSDGVPPGRVLLLGEGARLSLVLVKSGTEQQIHGPARISLRADGTLEGARAAATRILPALQGGLRLQPAALAQASVVMRESSASGWPGLAPAGPRLQDPQPEFTWEPVQGARFAFRITDGSGQTVFAATGSGNRQKPAAPLTPGVAYRWVLEVELEDGSTRAGEGRFQVLDEASRTALRLARPEAGASFADRFVYGALLNQLAVRDEAKAVWRALAQERPDDEALRRLARD